MSDERVKLEEKFQEVMVRLTRWASGLLPDSARRRVDTDDLVQDAMVGVLGVFPEIESVPTSRLLGYAQQAVVNRVRDEVRRSKIGETSRLGAIEPEGVEPSALTELLSKEERELLARAFARLRPTEQSVLVARSKLALPFRAVAWSLGLPSASAARAAFERASLRLAGELKLERSYVRRVGQRHSTPKR